MTHRQTAFVEIKFRACRPLLGMFLLLGLYGQPALSQNAASPNPQLQSIEAQVGAAIFTAGQPNSIKLTGTFTSTEGSLTQTGSAHMTLGADGTYQISLARTVGPTGESRSVSGGASSCTWTDQQGTVHNGGSLNCISPAWFFPALELLSGSNGASGLSWTPASYFTDTLGSHLRFQLVLPGSNTAQEDPPVSSSFDLVFAPNSNLPEYALFTEQPDNPGASVAIPVQIDYSNYQTVSGVMIPFRIQRFVNGSLVLDLTITSVSTQ